MLSHATLDSLLAHAHSLTYSLPPACLQTLHRSAQPSPPITIPHSSTFLHLGAHSPDSVISSSNRLINDIVTTLATSELSSQQQPPFSPHPMSAPAQDDLPARRTHRIADPGLSNSSHPGPTNPPATDDAWAAEDVDIPDGLSELFTTLPPPFSTSRSGSSSRRELAALGNEGGATSVLASSSSTPIATPATPSEQQFTLDALLGPPARLPHRRTPSQSRRTSAWRDSNASSALGMSFPNGRIGDQPQTSSDREHPRDRDESAWNGLATARAYYDSRSRMGAGQFARLETLTDLIDRNRHQPGRSSGERAPVRARLPPGPRTDSQGGPSSTLFNSLVRPVPTTSTSAATATATTSGLGTSITNERMATTVLRRRNGDGMRWANRAAYSFDPSDIAPPGGADDHIWDILGDPDSDDDMWDIYRMGEGDDVDGWGDPPEGGASLSRGRNNRRRSRHEDDSMSIDFTPGRFQPTNNSTEGSPIVVGRRRRRSAGTAPLKDANDMASKKRKCATPTLPPAQPDYLRYTCLPETSELPNDFMEPPRSSHLEVTYDGDRPIVTFGEQHRDQLQDSESDACALRANRSIPTGIGVHYYEVEVLDAGRLRYVSVGWMSRTSTLNRLVGWDRGTWGFHCDDGNSFAGQNHGNEFTEPWGSGDVVGVGIDFSTGRAFFTRNGALVGHAFADLPQHLFPAIGMRSPRESVRVNFGGPFIYDINKHVAEIAERVRAQHVPERWRFSAPAPETRIPKLVGVTLPPPPADGTIDPRGTDSVLGSGSGVFARGKAKGKAPVSPVNGLPQDSPLRDPAFRAETAFVLDHLQQNGHGRALSLLKQAMAKRGWVRPSPSSDGKGAQDLASFLAAFREGQVDRGLIPPLFGKIEQRVSVHELAQAAAAAAAAEEGEMADEADTRAIELGRELRARQRKEGWGEPEAELLGHAAALLAGRNSVAEAALATAREEDASAIDRAVRAELGLRPRSALSLAVAQMRLITDKLGEAGDGEAPFLGVDRLLPGASDDGTATCAAPSE